MTTTPSNTTTIPATSGKLTRRFVIALNDGLFIASGILLHMSARDFRSAFAEPVAPRNEREAQWTRIKLAHVDGRNCFVFNSPAHYDNWKSASLSAASIHP